MPPVVSFVGWHNSGKTTLTRKVVTLLKAKGYKVAVIKSTKETGIIVDQPGTDTDLYKKSGADAIALLAPDQLIIQRNPLAMELLQLAQMLFPEVDIVIAEGFKHAAQVPKIEVRRDPDAPLLWKQVDGVIAVASNLPHEGIQTFLLDQGREVADFIEKVFIAQQENSEDNPRA